MKEQQGKNKLYHASDEDQCNLYMSNSIPPNSICIKVTLK